MDQQVTITFPDVTKDRRNLLAESLARDLRRVRHEGPSLQPEVVRLDKGAQDFGATLVLVLGTPAIVVLANAIRDWARRNDRSEIEINGVRVKELNSADVAAVIDAIGRSTPHADSKTPPAG